MGITFSIYGEIQKSNVTFSSERVGRDFSALNRDFFKVKELEEKIEIIKKKDKNNFFVYLWWTIFLFLIERRLKTLKEDIYEKQKKCNCNFLLESEGFPYGASYICPQCGCSHCVL